MIDHREYFQKAAEEAANATCYRAKCGSVIVSKDGDIIGRGHNSPPLDDESQRTCNNDYDLSRIAKYDKTCCVHAEWNAILDACKANPDKIAGSTLYFMRIDDKGDFTEAGDPYCTVCSRLALQSGVSNFALWNTEPDIRSTLDYNQDSYNYHLK